MDDDDDDIDQGYDGWCPTCNRTGFIIVCPDDICRGSGRCVHGDGEIVCPDCDGGYYGT